MKKVLILLFVLVCLGGALFAAGYWLDIFVEDGRLHAAKKSPAESHSVMHAETFKTIEISADSADIEVVRGDDYGFAYISSRGKTTGWSNENGKLTIHQKNRSIFLNLAFLFGRNSIRVVVPASAGLTSTNIQVASGKITVSDIACAAIQTDAVSGNTTLDGIDVEVLKISATSGNIRLNNCRAGELEARLISGNLDADAMDTVATDISLTSGNAAVAGNFLGSNKLTAVSGDITLLVDGQKTKYNRKISVISGSVTIDGVPTQSEIYENASSKNAFDISVTSGNVRISFTG